MLDDVELHVTCWALPTQVQGIVRGKHIYFRERNGYWTFSWGYSEEEAVSKSVNGHADVAAHCPEFMDAYYALALTKALCAIYVERDVNYG